MHNKFVQAVKAARNEAWVRPNVEGIEYKDYRRKKCSESKERLSTTDVKQIWYTLD